LVFSWFPDDVISGVIIIIIIIPLHIFDNPLRWSKRVKEIKKYDLKSRHQWCNVHTKSQESTSSRSGITAFVQTDINGDDVITADGIIRAAKGIPITTIVTKATMMTKVNVVTMKSEVNVVTV
jgi:hypothetical protein